MDEEKKAAIASKKMGRVPPVSDKNVTSSLNSSIENKPVGGVTGLQGMLDSGIVSSGRASGANLEKGDGDGDKKS